MIPRTRHLGTYTNLSVPRTYWMILLRRVLFGICVKQISLKSILKILIYFLPLWLEPKHRQFPLIQKALEMVY